MPKVASRTQAQFPSTEGWREATGWSPYLPSPLLGVGGLEIREPSSSESADHPDPLGHPSMEGNVARRFSPAKEASHEYRVKERSPYWRKPESPPR